MPQLVSKLVKFLTALALSGLIESATALEVAVPASGPDLATTSTSGLRSILEPALGPDTPEQHFTMLPPAQPAGWEMLLAALLTGGFIARRRLSRH